MLEHYFFLSFSNFFGDKESKEVFGKLIFTRIKLTINEFTKI